MQRFVINSRTYGNVEFTCSGNLSNSRHTPYQVMLVSCTTLGWTLVTACLGGAVSAGAPVYADEATLQRAAKRWWRQAKPLLDAHVRPSVGDLRIDVVQWVYCGVRKSHTIVTVSEFSSDDAWVHVGKWFVPIEIAKSGRPAMLTYIKDKMAEGQKEVA